MTTRHPASVRVNDVRRLAGEGSVSPAEFHSIWSGERKCPERELAAAVLETAVVDLLQNRDGGHGSRQRVYWQAYEWVASVERDWPFSFVNICESLHLSAEALRARLLGSPLHDMATVTAAGDFRGGA
jgi:hypothetical protein